MFTLVIVMHCYNQEIPSMFGYTVLIDKSLFRIFIVVIVVILTEVNFARHITFIFYKSVLKERFPRATITIFSMQNESLTIKSDRLKRSLMIRTDDLGKRVITQQRWTNMDNNGPWWLLYYFLTRDFSNFDLFLIITIIWIGP